MNEFGSKTASPDRYGILKTFAKENRRNMTLCERLLWEALREELREVRFRRQHPIGDYIVDFDAQSVSAAHADITKAFQEVDGIQEVTTAVSTTFAADETTTASRTWWSPPSSSTDSTTTAVTAATEADNDEN